MNILTFFHLCDNDNYVPRGQEGYNPVNNLGTIYSAVTGNFSDVWKPGKNICIDEGMIPFRGKVHFKVYNSDKPDKYSVNCLSHTSCVTQVMGIVVGLKFPLM